MTLEEEIDIAKNTLTDYLAVKKMRKTPERYEILAFIYEQPIHISADKIYELMQEKFRVSRATVYNTLDLLTECNLIVKHQFGDQQAVYEKTPNNSHHHRICTVCGSVKEFTDQKIKKAIKAHSFNSFEPSHYSLYLYGVCKKCSKQLKKMT